MKLFGFLCRKLFFYDLLRDAVRGVPKSPHIWTPVLEKISHILDKRGSTYFQKLPSYFVQFGPEKLQSTLSELLRKCIYNSCGGSWFNVIKASLPLSFEATAKGGYQKLFFKLLVRKIQ